MDVSDYFALLKARRLPVVVDDERLRAPLAALGFATTRFDDYDFAAPTTAPAFTILTQLSYHDRFMELWDKTDNILSHIALAKFDGSPACVDYSLRHFASIDYDAALRQRSDIYDHVVTCRGIEVETDAGILRCRLNDDSIELANTDLEMKPGWLYSVAEFLEASVVNTEADRSSFIVDGRFAFTGLIHLYNSPSLREHYGALFTELGRRAAAGGNVAEWEDNCLVRLEIGGVDVSALLLDRLAGKERGTSATELSFGCVEYPLEQDWRMNSLLHESSLGVHLGIGLSREIPHIDLIARGATWRFLE